MVTLRVTPHGVKPFRAAARAAVWSWLVLGSLVFSTAAWAQGVELSLDRVGTVLSSTDLELGFDAVCPDGKPGAVTQIHFSPVAPSSLFAPFDASPEKGLLSPVGFRVRELCEAVKDKTQDVEVGTKVTVRCSDGDRSADYGLFFELFCDGGAAEIHAPSGGDPGPYGVIEMEGTYGSVGASVGYLRQLGASGRHSLRLSMGVRELSRTLPVGSRPQEPFPEEPPSSAATPLEADFQVVPLDLTYGCNLLAPDHRVVPSVFAGAGWAFARLEGPHLETDSLVDVTGQDLLPDRDPLEGFAEDGLSLNAGLRLQVRLGGQSSYGKGKYLYFGARTHWYAGRDDDRAETEVFFGLGLPVCLGGRR